MRKIINHSLKTYKKVFNTEFNLNFHAPGKDTCLKWDVVMRKRSYILGKVIIYIFNVPNKLGTVWQKTSKNQNDNPTGNIMDSHLICKKHSRIPKLSVSQVYYKSKKFFINEIFMYTQPTCSSGHYADPIWAISWAPRGFPRWGLSNSCPRAPRGAHMR